MSEGWLDQFFPGIKELDQTLEAPTQEQLDTILEQHVRRNQEDYSRDFQSMNDAMTPLHRAWWVKQGIPEDYQDFWYLGMVEHKNIQLHGELVDAGLAYTIPKFDLGWRHINMDYRLANPPLSGGKYRPEPGLPPAPFFSRPDLDTLDNNGLALIMEGSKKAMVTSIYLDNLQVIGLPSCTSWAGIQDRIQAVRTKVVVLDPDAERAAAKLVTLAGSNCIRVTLPTKIDDAFLDGSLTPKLFWKLVKMNGRHT
jgi:hypothetical protein